MEKVAPDGRAVYKLVLAGESEDLPQQFFFDGQGNVVLLGTTYSTKFPVTPDAAQTRYAGPQPTIMSGYRITSGGDLFLSVVSPSGGLLYSTFLGSSASDNIIGARAGPGGVIDILATAGGANFPVNLPGTAAPSGGPLLLNFDTNRRAVARSAYLPIGAPPGGTVAYRALWQEDGAVLVTTPSALFTFSRDGQLRAFVSLESFTFDGLPFLTKDPAGDVWLVGQTKSRQPLVARLVSGMVEAFRWTLPVEGGMPYLSPPYFGPDGLAYVGGGTFIMNDTGRLRSTTPNALLTAPCSWSAGIVAVLSPQGELKLLSYLANSPRSFTADGEGGVSAILNDVQKTRVAIDLSQRPKIGCLADPLRSFPRPPFGVGQVLRLRGGGFGPESPVEAAPGADRRFPTSLDELQVQVAGTAAPILSAAAGEVVIALPFRTPEGDSVPVSVEARGQRSAEFPIPVRALAPQLVEPVLNEDGTPNHFDAPARWGSTVTVFLTGAGSYTPPLDDGQIAAADALARLEQPVGVSFQIIGPIPEPGSVLYAGPAPGFIAGLTQINIQLPPSRPYPYPSILPLLKIASASLMLPSIWVK